MAFQLNVDWFQPFEGTEFSADAIYLSCLNLPRDIRYLRENVFLVAMFPGEPKMGTAMSHILEPLVAELIVLWADGVNMVVTFDYPCGRLVRVWALGINCDLPAARKCGGFANFTAHVVVRIAKRSSRDLIGAQMMGIVTAMRMAKQILHLVLIGRVSMMRLNGNPGNTMNMYVWRKKIETFLPLPSSLAI